MPLRSTIRLGIELIRSCMRSRLAWLLASIHGVWFFLAIANMSPPSRAFANFLDSMSWSDTTIFAGRPYHFTYESIWLKSLVVADLPAGLAAIPLSIVLSPVDRMGHFDTYTESYVVAGFFFVVATFQWLIIGRATEMGLAAHPWGNTALRQVNQSSTVLIAVLALLAVVPVPIVDRSRQVHATHTLAR